MRGNKQAYDEAYERALAGGSSYGLWTRIRSLFEDDYTRRSREEGERDGNAAREAATVDSTPQSASAAEG